MSSFFLAVNRMYQNEYGSSVAIWYISSNVFTGYTAEISSSKLWSLSLFLSRQDQHELDIDSNSRTDQTKFLGADNSRDHHMTSSNKQGI